MTHISRFDYVLPEGCIAYHPTRRRDSSRLMVVDRNTGELDHKKFPAIVDYVNKGDALIINNTRVFKARLFCRRPSGGKVEIFLLGEVKFNGRNSWVVITHPTRRVKEGEKLFLEDGSTFEIVSKLADGKTIIRFKSKVEAARIISQMGHVPLPIYIHRPDETSDETRYQTVYADEKKSQAVAAPTAGLHFTERILDKIMAKGVKIIPLTLNVGYGTFKTVKAEEIEQHTVDPEYAELSKSSANAINKVKSRGGRIFAVGTTSVRALESAPVVEGLVQPFSGLIDLYIKPGFQFRIVDHLITNFHLPRSSLLILVSAFAGREKVLEAYNIAVKEGYRFYSYGDCMLIL